MQLDLNNQKEVDTILVSEDIDRPEFAIGENVCNVYFTGLVCAPAMKDSSSGAIYYPVMVSDADQRINGKVCQFFAGELKAGNVPQYESAYWESRNNSVTNADRELSYGEIKVNMTLNNEGIDSLPYVLEVKKMFAAIIDTNVFYQRQREKANFIESITPNYKLGAKLNLAKQFADAEALMIKAKNLMISALIGNNEEA